MNKNTKKFVVTLLSVLMVLSFMPTMAFAETTSGEFNAAHNWDYDDAEELVAPTCYAGGIVVGKCDKDGGICNATHFKTTAPLEHEWVSERFDTAADYAAALLLNGAFGTGEASLIAAVEWLDGTGANVCYGYADVCSVCGALKVTTPGDNNLYGLTATEHKEPEKTKDCAASFKCAICNKEDAVNSTHNKTTSAAYHALTSAHVTPETLEGSYCTTTLERTYNSEVYTITAWEQVTVYTCNECKKVVGKTHQVRDNSSWWEAKDAELNHNMTETVLKEATCEEAGEKADVCADCGYQGPVKNIPKLAHDYSVKVTVPATIANPEYSYNVCKYCGKVDTDSYEYYGKPLSNKSSYTLEVLRDKTCEDGGIVKVTFTQENAPENNKVDYFTYDHASGEYKWLFVSYPVQYNTTDKDYFRGFYGELPASDGVEIPDIKPTGHKWAKAAKVADATCTMPEQEAMTCTICGCIKHPTTKIGKALGHEVDEVIVAPTCGTAGYTYKICTRCHNYLTTDGKNESLFPRRYDETDPVVKLGAECTFDTWKVLKEATADEDGSKILTCSKCGAELAGSETVIPADTDAKKDETIKEYADPALEGAYLILSKSDKYTTDSIKAIDEAQKALNQAIASGTAADVKRAAEVLQGAVEAAKAKAESSLTAKGKTVKASSKKKMTFKKTKAFTVKNAAGKVTFKKTKGNKKVTVSKAGKVTVKKGLKKGKTYKIKVKVTDAGSGTVLGASKTVTLKVKITK